MRRVSASSAIFSGVAPILPRHVEEEDAPQQEVKTPHEDEAKHEREADVQHEREAEAQHEGEAEEEVELDRVGLGCREGNRADAFAAARC